MRSIPLLACVVATLLGCRSTQTSDPFATATAGPEHGSEASPVPTESSVDGLSVSINGKAAKMASARAYSRGDRSFDVLISSAKPSCEDASGGVRKLAKDEIYITIRLAPVLARDGSESWQIVEGKLGIHFMPLRDIGTVSVHGEPDVSKPVSLNFALAAEIAADAMFDTPAQKVAIQGPVVADGCGVKRLDKAKPRSQPDLSVTVSGKKIDVRGAVARPSDAPGSGFVLTLSTLPMDCEMPFDTTPDVQLGFTVDSDNQVTNVDLQGRMLLSRGAFPAEWGKLTAEPEESIAGIGDVMLSLEGERTTMGRAVNAKGMVKAMRCPKR